MLIHVALADAAGARTLVHRLEGVIDGSSVSVLPGHTEVAVELDPEPDRTLARVVDVVCTWLEGDRDRAARVRLGGRSHALFGSTPTASAG